MSSQEEKWYLVKDGVLYKHTENDGYQFMKKGAQAHDEPIMTVEEAKIKCPEKLAQAYGGRQVTEELTIAGTALLVEQHQKEIWEWKQKESQWIRDKNQLEGNKQIITELSSKLIELGRANLILKKRAQEAEGENTIIKGIGNNSPEMKELQGQVTELKGRIGSAQDINDNHQRYNGKLQTRLTEVEEDNKNLAKQIQDLTTSRKFGDGTH